MELPGRSFPISRLNCLQGTIHPSLGLVWTDGRSIYVIGVGKRISSTKELKTDAIPVDERLEAVYWNNIPATQLGRKNDEDAECIFERCVRYVHPLEITDENASIVLFLVHYHQTALLCVTTRKSTIIVNVSSISSTLHTRHILALPYAPLFTGVLWNPAFSNVLSLLTKEKCYLITGIGMDQCKFCLPQVSSPSLSCGTWTPDGRTLLLGLSDAIEIWSWSDESAMMVDDLPTARRKIVKRPDGVRGDILSLHAISNDLVVLTTSAPNILPITAFDHTSPPLLSPSIDPPDSVHKDDNENDNKIITVQRRSPQERHPLFHIHRRDQTALLDSSSQPRHSASTAVDSKHAGCVAQLALLAKSADGWRWMTEVPIPGILSPDIVAVNLGSSSSSNGVMEKDHVISDRNLNGVYQAEQTTESNSREEDANGNCGKDGNSKAEAFSAEIVIGSGSADRLLRFRLRDGNFETTDVIPLPKGHRAKGLASSRHFLSGKAPSPFVVAVSGSSSSSSSSFSSSSSAFPPSSFPSPSFTNSPLDHAFVPSKLDAVLPVSLHFLDSSFFRPLSAGDAAVVDDSSPASLSASKSSIVPSPLTDDSANENGLSFETAACLKRLSATTCVNYDRKWDGTGDSTSDNSINKTIVAAARADNENSKDTLKDLVRDCVFALRATDPKEVEDGSCDWLKKESIVPTSTSADTMATACFNGDRICELFEDSSSNNGSELSKAEDVDGKDALNDLVRDCVFALRAADPKEVEDGSCDWLKKDPTSKSANAIAGSGQKELSANENGRGLLDLLSDVGEMFDATPTSQEEKQFCMKDNSFSIESSKINLRDALESGKKGPIDMMAILSGEERFGRKENVSETIVENASDFSVTVGACKKGPIDLTSLLSSQRDSIPRMSNAFKLADGCRGNNNNNKSTNNHSTNKDDQIKLALLDERLCAVETKLMQRLKNRRKPLSTANCVELLEMRVGRIEKLVEMICDN